MTTPITTGALTPATRDELFGWLDAQRAAGATPGWTTAPLLAAGFDVSLGTARRVVCAWMLVHVGTDDPKETA